MKEHWPGFGPADILLPKGCDLSKWSVVACDQYTSQNDYWQRVTERVGDAPSALKLILPESKLEDGRTEEHIRAINTAMRDYLDADLFQVYPDALIYVERWLDGDTAGLFVRRTDGKTLVDLREADRRRMLQLGARAEHLDVSEECTMCSHERYWSHRYTKGIRGSQAACIVLE